MKSEIQKELSEYFDISQYIFDNSMALVLKTFKVQSA